MNGAAAIVADQQITMTDVLEIVANLAAKSLVATDISRDVTYHRLLDTTRVYALEKLTGSPRSNLSHYATRSTTETS